MQHIETIDWLYGPNPPSLTLITQMGDSEAVLYGSHDSRESNAMVDLLNELGVKFEFRAIDRDLGAMREWEQLDGIAFRCFASATTESCAALTGSSCSSCSVGSAAD